MQTGLLSVLIVNINFNISFYLFDFSVELIELGLVSQPFCGFLEQAASLIQSTLSNHRMGKTN